MEEIKASVRSMEITEWGREKLPAGPDITESDEVIIVEGRADVINLLKNGFRNCIAMNGTSVPQTIAELSKTKTITVFVDGDRGGILIVKELLQAADIDFVSRAPAGKEVEELAKKEIHKCIRARIPVEQFKEEFGLSIEGTPKAVPAIPVQARPVQRPSLRIHPEIEKQYKKMLEELIGTRGAYLLDKDMNILGKVPTKELGNVLNNLPDVENIVMDEQLTQDMIRQLEETNITHVIAMSSVAQSRKIRIITAKDLGLA